jgi:hypothetical protein
MRKQQHKTKAKKPMAPSKPTRAFRDLLAAEELLQTTIQAMITLGAGEFTSGLSEERHRLLAKLDGMQDKVYTTLENSSNVIALR